MTEVEECGWMLFTKLKRGRNKRTDVWHVTSVGNKSELGFVQWWSHWRRYVFCSLAARFDGDCLRTLAEFCERKTREHKEVPKDGQGVT